MGFNEIKRTYGVGVNDIAHKLHLYCVKKLLSFAESISPITTVLDCPCGSGRFSGLFKKYKLTCGDLSDSRLSSAKKLVSGDDIKFIHCDLFQMPFQNSSYDFILCAFVLQHIKKEKYPDVFKELSRVTKSWVLLTYNTNFAPLRFHRLLKAPKTKLTDGEFNTICNESGFNIIKEMYAFPFLAATKFVLLRKNSPEIASVATGQG